MGEGGGDDLEGGGGWGKGERINLEGGGGEDQSGGGRGGEWEEDLIWRGEGRGRGGGGGVSGGRGGGVSGGRGVSMVVCCIDVHVAWDRSYSHFCHFMLARCTTTPTCSACLKLDPLKSNFS